MTGKSTPTVPKETVRFVTMDHDQTIVVELESSSIVGGKVIHKPIRTVQFQGPYLQTSDPEIIAIIRGLDSFNKRTFENVIPDDLVQVGNAKVTRYVCSYPGCDFVAFTSDGIKAHKKDTHAKKSLGLKGLRSTKKNKNDDDGDMVKDA